MRGYLFFDKSLRKPLIITIKNLIKNRLKQAKSSQLLSLDKRAYKDFTLIFQNIFPGANIPFGSSECFNAFIAFITG
jgi:hypothetical protein